MPASVFGAKAPSNRITLACIGVGNQGTPILDKFLKLAGLPGGGGVRREPRQPRLQGRRAVSRPRAGASRWSRSTTPSKNGAGDYKGCDAYNDFREVLARDDIDAVTVVPPDHWHAPMTIAAAEAKKDIYCEKPLGLTIGDGQAMIAAVRKHGIVLQTGSHERSNPIVRQACELVRNGYIGDVKRVLTHVGRHNKVGPGPGWKPMPVPEGFDYAMWLGPAPEAPYHQDRCLYSFRFNYDYAGGQVTNFGAHSNDMAQWGLGMDETGPVEVECVYAKFLPKGSLFNAATQTKFRCRYANGVELVCQTAEPSVRAVFEGTEGRVEVENKGQNFKTTPESLAKRRAARRPAAVQERRSPAELSRLHQVAARIRRRRSKSAIAARPSATWATSPCGMNAKLKWDPDEGAVRRQRRGKRVSCIERCEARGRFRSDCSDRSKRSRVTIESHPKPQIEAGARRRRQRRPTCRVVGAELYLLPVETRMPLKFGAGDADVGHLRARAGDGGRPRRAGRPRAGARRRSACSGPGRASCRTACGNEALHAVLPAAGGGVGRVRRVRASAGGRATRFSRHAAAGACGSSSIDDAPASERLPLLAALVCCSPFDIALHDAYGAAARAAGLRNVRPGVS